MLGPAVRVPAADICHIYERRVPGQVRGLSWLAPVATRLIELHKLEDALLARMNTAALFAGFVTDAEGRGAGMTDGATTDPAQLSLEPGVLRMLPVGTTVNFPNVPGIEGAPELLGHMLRSIASGCGLPAPIMASNYGDVNYSSGTLGLGQFIRRVKSIQASLLVGQFLQPVWNRFVALEVLSGRLHAPEFMRDPSPYFAVSFLFPAWPTLESARRGARRRDHASTLAFARAPKSSPPAAATSPMSMPKLNPTRSARPQRHRPRRQRRIKMSSLNNLLLRENSTALEIREAAMRPRTFDPSASTVEAIIATDAAVARRDARGAFLEILDVAGADLEALRGASVLDSHQQQGVAAVLGTVDEAWREGAQLIARIRLSTRPEVAAVVEDVRAGVIRHLSIGYEVSEWRDGTNAQGQRTRTAVKWSPREV